MKTFTDSLNCQTRRGLWPRVASIAVLLSLVLAVACGGGGGSTPPPPPPTPTAATPAFSVAAGTYSSDQTVTISTTTAGATIHYTTDGNAPTSASPTYTAAITISATTTLKAIAIASGYNNSTVATATYTLKVATPTVSVAAGTYAGTQTVTIGTTTPGATIYYTTDGSAPTTSSTQYTAAITIASSKTVKAIATKTGYTTSDALTSAYQIKATAPTFSPVAGTYTTVQTVTISTTTPNSSIRYTTDGSTPTAASTLYAAPVSVGTTQTIKAIATSGTLTYADSDVATAVYTINLPKAATPTFSVAAGTYTAVQSVTLSSTTPGAVIHYTTDGSTPTASSATYTSALSVDHSQTIKATATATNHLDSDVASAAYVIDLPKVGTPYPNYAWGAYNEPLNLILTVDTPGATLYYTLDGSTPTTSSTVYTAPFTLSSSATLKMMAAKPGMANSDVASYAYRIVAYPPQFNPPGGTYDAIQYVTLTSATAGAEIYYTTDGNTPTTSSTKYTAPIAIGKNTLLKAMAIAPGYEGSFVPSATYYINLPQPSYTWKNVQIIAGGFITGINFHPAEQNLIYSRTDIGGAYRWDNTKQEWIPLNDWVGFDNSNYMGIEAIGLDPSDPQRLYLAGGTYVQSWAGNGAMLVSTNKGDSFTTVPMPFKMGGNEDGRFAGNRLAVDPNLGSKLYYGSRGDGLWTSANYGASWTKVANFPVTGATNGAGIVFVEFVKSSGSSGSATPVIYVGVSDTAGTYSRLYRSTNAGSTWTAVPNQPAYLATQFPNHGYFGPDGSLYMTFGNNIGPNGMSTGKVVKYTPTAGDANGAGTWTDITPPNPSYQTNGSWGYGGLAVDQANPGTLMVMTMDLWWLHDNMYRSVDGGNTWIELGQTSVRDASLSPYVNWGGSSPGVGNWAQIAIDPFDANHVLYCTGATMWKSTNVRNSEPGLAISGSTLLAGGVTNWTIGAKGIEETAVTALISPPSGANLISGLGDIHGFVHNDLTISPPGGMESPLFTTTRGLDFAQNNPSVIVRVGDSSGTTGTYSTNGGTSWTGMAGKYGSGGSVAVSADGNRFVWVPDGKIAAYSTDHGTTWIPSTGSPSGVRVFSDRVNSNKFYLFDVGNKTLYRSTDGGVSFSPANSALPITQTWTNPQLSVSYAAEGDLWLATDSGLYHSTDSGTTFTKISTVQVGYSLGFGKAAVGADYPTLYLAGQVNGVKAIYRSTDKGLTWIRINDDQHQYGWVGLVIGDPRIFGRVYMSTNGRGIVYGDSQY